LGNERALTSWLADHFAGPRPDVLVGIGDDGAVVRAGGRDLVVCCDPVIEGVHFTADAPRALVGRKAVQRNLSDLAAMGATPDWIVVSAVLPAGMSPRRRRAVFDGVRAAAEEAGCAVIGGDVASTTGPLTLTVTAIGHLTSAPLRRDGAKVGDALHVSGALGGASLGKHLRFRAHLAEGCWLADQECVNAAIDVSDGLLLDLQTMLDASGGLGAELQADAIPVARAARRLSAQDGISAVQHALTDGEDHVLLFSVAEGGVLNPGGPLADAARRPIGRLLQRPGLWVVDRDGTRRPLTAEGFEHEL